MTVEALWNLGDARKQQGCSGDARTLYEEAITLAREVGDLQSLGICLGALGDLVLLEGNPREAQAYLEQGLPFVGMKAFGGVFRGKLALCHARQKKLAVARDLLHQGEALLHESGCFSELGLLLCTRVRVERLANDHVAAEQALIEAKKLANRDLQWIQSHRWTPRKELRRQYRPR